MDGAELVEPPIKIEFDRKSGGLQDVSRASDVARESSVAIAEAMGIVRQMADKVQTTVESMAAPPSEVELSFGITFDSEAGALVAKVGVEAALNVTLRWTAGTKANAK